MSLYRPKIKLYRAEVTRELAPEIPDWAILMACDQAAKIAGWTEEDISKFMTEAKAGDREHLINTCKKYYDVT